MLNSTFKNPDKVVIEREARALGFDAFGVTSADSVTSNGVELSDFVAAGHHGDMVWMKERLFHRSHPRHLWPDVRSIIVLGMNYGPLGDPRFLLDHKERANISVYARGKDYHDVIKKKLKALARFLVAEYGCQLKVFVDTAPVMEKPLAAAAGLGWQGKHTNLVSRDFGSWLFLGAIYTDMKINRDTPHTDRCGRCTACLDACPTHAFTGPYKIDARRCISYLTIEHKGPIPHEFRKKMGNRIYGCDDCLAACPWNKFAQISSEASFFARVELLAPKLKELLGLDDKSFREVFSGSPIKRIGRNRFIRNCLIAAGNSGDRSLLPLVKKLKCDGDDVIRDAASWAYHELKQ